MTTMTIKQGDWATLSKFAYPVRKQVFVVEQGVPDSLEWDDADHTSLHAVAFDANGTALGTGRLLPDGRIGRMAVLASARGLGVGARLLDSLMHAAVQRGDRRLVLSAQVQAEGFYGKFGFVRFGAEFVEADIPHIEMEHLVP